jgi:hypothetical protein
MSAHRCHADGCNTEVPPRLLFCGKHWRMTPPHLRRAVWAHYREGQEIDKCPSYEYLEAMRAAIEAVARSEGRREPPGAPALPLEEAP